MTVEKNGPFYRITMLPYEINAIRSMLPSDMQAKIKEAEDYWETQKPRIRNAAKDG